VVGGLIDGGRERLQVLPARHELPLNLPKERRVKAVAGPDLARPCLQLGKVLFVLL
jgi:hypothetical protein